MMKVKVEAKVLADNSIFIDFLKKRATICSPFLYLNRIAFSTFFTKLPNYEDFFRYIRRKYNSQVL